MCTTTITTTSTRPPGSLGSLHGMPITIAVDANGADLGPAEVAAGAADAAQQGVRVVLFGPAEQFGEVGEGIEVVDAPVSIAKAPDPVRASRANPDASIVLAARAVAAGDADAFVSGGSTGPALAAALFNIKRASGIHRPALAIPVPVPGHPVTIVDVGANTEVRAEHLVQFGFMGAALAQVVLGIERPRVGLLSIGEEPSKGTPLVIEAHAALRDRLAEGDTFDFVGNVEGNEVPAGKADVVVTDGFTGNIALKLMEGVSEEMLRQIRDVATSSRRAKAGGMLLRPALLEFREVIDPESAGRGLPPGPAPARRGAPWALQPPRHRPGDPAGGPRRRGRRGGPHARRTRGRARAAVGPAVRIALYGCLAMTREEVFSLIQSYLADELEVDPARIDESTRFKEDLEADSLDLYTLVQELEDSYGVKMSDEEAARILSVGQAVDFVVAHAPTTT